MGKPDTPLTVNSDLVPSLEELQNQYQCDWTPEEEKKAKRKYALTHPYSTP